MIAPKIQILPLRKASSSPSSGEDSPPQDSSTDSGQQAVKKKRTSKPKVRSGCITCKIRRVKCDETKPECNRCTSTGRKCDGYSIPPRKKRTSPLAKQTLQPTSEIGPEELRALDFFHHKTAPALSSYFDADFWTRLVFQMSYVEPTIRHAMVALGTLHEKRENGMRLVPSSMSESVVVVPSNTETTVFSTSNDHNDQFALVQYGKAISHLSDRLKSESSVEVALLACILFVCVEFLRGDVEPVLNHFRSGMSIAMSLMSRTDIPMTEETTKRVKEYMLPVLNRIELLSSVFGNDATWDYPIQLSEAVPAQFNGVKEARDSFVHLANLSVRFIRYMKFRRYSRLVLPDDLSRQEALKRYLELWSTKMDDMLLSNNFTPKELDAAKILRMHQIIAHHWVVRATWAEECASDNTMDTFESAVRLAEAAHGVNGSTNHEPISNPSTFLFDMEIVSPLYYVAANCRHPRIRRRAIALLKASNRREGLWDSNKAAAVAERIMHHEEAKLIKLDGSELPAEEDRIHYAQIDSEVGTNPRHHTVRFHTKPKGIDGPWKIWKEDIILP